MFKKGDRVIYKSDPRRLKGTVITVAQNGHWMTSISVLVEFDDWSLIPRRMELRDTDLELIAGDEFHYQATDMRTCECGLKFIREGGMHSIWCPMYRKSE